MTTLQEGANWIDPGTQSLFSCKLDHIGHRKDSEYEDSSQSSPAVNLPLDNLVSAKEENLRCIVSETSQSIKLKFVKEAAIPMSPTLTANGGGVAIALANGDQVATSNNHKSSKSSCTKAPDVTTSTVDPRNVKQIGKYRLERKIGRGTYGEVRQATNLEKNEVVAIKIIWKDTIKSDRQITRIQREVRFQRLLRHPHVVRIYDVIETNYAIYIVMEYVKNGEFFDYLIQKRRLSEDEARKYFLQMLSSIDYCHQNSIIHRDIKPENILMDDLGNLKLADFGFSNTYEASFLLRTFCGSPYYAAPEMILGKEYTGPEVDVWSLGIILFVMICGYLPFDHRDHTMLNKMITLGRFIFPKFVSKSSKELLVRMIEVDPEKRATLEEVKNHPWTTEKCHTAFFHSVPIRPSVRSDSIDQKVFQRLKQYGYGDRDIIHGLAQSDRHPIKSLYYLLIEAATVQSDCSSCQKMEISIPMESVNGDEHKETDLLISTKSTLPDQHQDRKSERMSHQMIHSHPGSNTGDGTPLMNQPLSRKENLDRHSRTNVFSHFMSKLTSLTKRKDGYMISENGNGGWRMNTRSANTSKAHAGSNKTDSNAMEIDVVNGKGSKLMTHKSVNGITRQESTQCLQLNTSWLNEQIKTRKSSLEIVSSIHSILQSLGILYKYSARDSNDECYTLDCRSDESQSVHLQAKISLISTSSSDEASMTPLTIQVTRISGSVQRYCKLCQCLLSEL